MNKGLFVVFEGCDGSGKTTVSTKVYEKLKELNYQVIYTREPGGSRIAEEVRDIILDPKNTDMDPRTEALLYAASRRQHLKDIILPNLEQGKIIICDRFILSSLVYQGIARGIGYQQVLDINEFAIEGVWPDSIIFLDIEAEVGLERIQGRKQLDRLDSESLDFHQRVFNGYQTVIKDHSHNLHIIDANRKVDLIVEDCVNYIKTLVK